MTEERSKVYGDVYEDEIQQTNFVKALYTSADFLVTRYPYICAVLLMLSMPDKIRNDKNRKIDLDFIYYEIGFYFVVGTLLSFDLFKLKKFSAFIMALHSAILAWREFDSSYRQIIQARLLFRSLALVGCFLMVAGGLEKENGTLKRNTQLLKLGRQIIGAYVVLLGILLVHNGREFKIHARFIPAGAVWFLVVCYVVCGVCIDYGVVVVKSCKFILLLLFVVSLMIDMDEDVWLKYGNIKKWTMFTIAARHMPLLGVLLQLRDGYY